MHRCLRRYGATIFGQIDTYYQQIPGIPQIQVRFLITTAILLDLITVSPHLEYTNKCLPWARLTNVMPKSRASKTARSVSSLNDTISEVASVMPG
jgi:hypothetical protein